MKKGVLLGVIIAVVLAVGCLAFWINSQSKTAAPSPVVQFKESRMQFFVCEVVDRDRLGGKNENLFELTEEQCESVEELNIRYATEYETLEDLLLLKNLKVLRMVRATDPENIDEFRKSREERSQHLLRQLELILPQLDQLTVLAIDADMTVHDLSFLQDVHTLRRLVLTCSPEDITGISHMQDLEKVGIGDDLVDITPLAALKNLVEVDLCDNQIVDITPLQNLEKLEIALLRNNQITDITPLMGLKNLKVIWITGNPVCEDEEKMKALQEALPDTWIDYFNQ